MIEILRQMPVRRRLTLGIRAINVILCLGLLVFALR